MTSVRAEPLASAPSTPSETPAAARARVATRASDWAIPLACVTVAVAATWTSTHTSLWIDEAYALDTAHHSWSGTWHQAVAFELQPPLYFMLLHAWLGIHDSIIWARALSTIFAMGAVAVMGAIGGLLAGRNGRWMALVAAASPTLLWAASVSRGYAMVLLLTASSLYFFLRLTVIDTPHPRRDILGYAACTYAALLSAYYSGFLLPGELFAAALLGRREARRVAAALMLVTVAFLPWAPIAGFQAMHHPNQNPTDGLVGQGVMGRLGAIGHLAAAGAFAAAPAANRPDILLLTCIVLLAVPVARLLAPAGQPPVRWTPAETALAVPLAFAFVSLSALRFLDMSTVLWRHLAVLLPVTIALWTLWVIRTRPIVRPITGLAAAVILANMAGSRLHNPQVADFKDAATWVGARAKPDEVVFVVGPEAVLTFGYYYQEHSPLFGVPAAASTAHYTPAAFAVHDTAQIAIRWREAPLSPRAWLVLEDYDVDHGRTVGLVKAFVDQHYRTVSTQDFRYLHVLQLAAQ